MSGIECTQLHSELFRRMHSTRQSHGLFALAKHKSWAAALTSIINIHYAAQPVTQDYSSLWSKSDKTFDNVREPPVLAAPSKLLRLQLSRRRCSGSQGKRCAGSWLLACSWCFWSTSWWVASSFGTWSVRSIATKCSSGAFWRHRFNNYSVLTVFGQN